MRTLLSLVLLISSLLLTANPDSLQAQRKLLGKIDFPNSGAQEAQSDFIQGVLFLHNFEYADAARSFQIARVKDPGIVIATAEEGKET